MNKGKSVIFRKKRERKTIFKAQNRQYLVNFDDIRVLVVGLRGREEEGERGQGEKKNEKKYEREGTL